MSNFHFYINYSILELRQAFDLFDTDSSGGISVNELKQALCAMGVNVTDQEACQIFSAIDVDSNLKKMSFIIRFFFCLFLENGLLLANIEAIRLFFSPRSN